MPRKLAIFVTLTLQPLGMGIIVLEHRFSGGKPCTRTAKKVNQSHTRTVVRECFKGDEANKGKGQNSTPRHTKTP